MENILESLYKRYNQFGEWSDEIPIPNQFLMILLYREAKHHSIDIEKKIGEYICEKSCKNREHFQEIESELTEIQPKSIFIRIHILTLIAHSIPETFYKRIMYTADSIIEISTTIVLHYLVLQTFLYTEQPINQTEKRNLIGRTDFYFTLKEVQKVRGKTTEDELKKYLDLFAKDINVILENEMMGLFLDGNLPFIICITDFLDYLIFFLEDFFQKKALNNEYSLYSDKKGKTFEWMVYGITKEVFKESYHTLYYYPNGKQKMEIDVLLRDNQKIAVLECKSGTFNGEILQGDNYIKLQIQNKTKKAYNTLKYVTHYLENNEQYSFQCGDKKIEGKITSLFCIHISMYPMDFISSNIHVMFPCYLEKDNPILSVSVEHFFAMLIDSVVNKRDIFDYWEKRKADIKKYSKIYFDNNELDLFYEIVNEDNNTILAEMKKEGVLDQLGPNAKIISTFHNESGKEVRPSREMLRNLDMFFLASIFKKGKKWFGINKRYLKNMEEYLRIK